MSERAKQRFFDDDGLLVHRPDGTIERVDGQPLTDADRAAIAQMEPIPNPPEKSLAA